MIEKFTVTFYLKKLITAPQVFNSAIIGKETSKVKASYHFGNLQAANQNEDVAFSVYSIARVF